MRDHVQPFRPLQRLKPQRLSGVGRSLVALLTVFLIGALLVGPVDAKWGRGRTSPRTTVLSPKQDSVVEGGDILGVGRADHRVGVGGVLVVVKNLDDDTYWNGSGWQTEFVRTEAAVDGVGERKASWSLRVPEEALVDARYRVRGFAYTVEGNGDAYGGHLTEFDYRSEPSGPGSTTTTTPPLTVTTSTVAPTSSKPPTTTQSSTTQPTVTSTTLTSTTVTPTTATPTTSTSTTISAPSSTTSTTQPSGDCGDPSILVPCTGLLLGSTGDFADSDGNWQSPREDFRRQEERLGHDFDVFHDYNQWNHLINGSWPHRETQALADEGRIIFTNWKSPTSSPADWARIANGQFDDDIRTAARNIIAYDKPLFITFFHEPEDNIMSVAGDNIAKQDELVNDYAEAFAHIVNVFDDVGADNAIWVWNVQGWLGHQRLYDAGLYPGDDVVDWVAYNSYNWHGCDNHGNSPRWKEFEDVYQTFYDWLESDGPGRPGPDKPVMLGEWGTEENVGATNSDQTKAEWFDDARRHFVDGTFPRIKAAIYFDTEGVRADGSVQFCEWGLDSSAESLASFRTLMAEPALVPTWK